MPSPITLPQQPSADGVMFSPDMEAAFAHLDEQMYREGFSTASTHPFPRSGRASRSRTKRKKVNKGGRNSMAPSSATLNAYKPIDAVNLLGSRRSTKKRQRSTPVKTSGRAPAASEFGDFDTHGGGGSSRGPPPRTLEPLPTAPGGGIANLTDSALIAVETGKFQSQDLSATGSSGPSVAANSTVRLDPADMEAKKVGSVVVACCSLSPVANSPRQFSFVAQVLLPYLDRLDYIDVELSRRNLGEERMGAGIAGTLNVGAPSPAHRVPVPETPLRSSTVAFDEEFNDDMFFRAPTPSPRTSSNKRQKKTLRGKPR